jgi:hypothetical protein
MHGSAGPTNFKERNTEMDTNQAMVLQKTEHLLNKAAKEAAAPLELDAGDAGDVEGMDAGAVQEAAGDAGAPPGLLIPETHLYRAVADLEQAGITDQGIVELAKKAAMIQGRHAHRHGHRTGFLRGVRYAHRVGIPRLVPGASMRVHDWPVHWQRSATMRDYRYDVIARYAAVHNGLVDSAPGFYYGTVQVIFGVDGNNTNAYFTLTVPQGSTAFPAPIVDTCFDLAIGQIEQQWFGGPYKLTLADTNLQNPGQNLYPDECFINEAVSTDLKAVRIQYDPNQIPDFASLSAPTQAALTGKAPIWDRDGHVLPNGVFNTFDDTCELAQAVAEVGVFSFSWQNLGLGANNTISNKPIERMKAVPGASRRGVRETSGGALSLDLPRGYLWMLDQQFQANEDEGGNGLFSLNLGLFDNVVFPFTPVQVAGSGSPLIPLGLAIEWQFTIHGTSLVPAKAHRSRFAPRRT